MIRAGSNTYRSSFVPSSALTVLLRGPYSPRPGLCLCVAFRLLLAKSLFESMRVALVPSSYCLSRSRQSVRLVQTKRLFVTCSPRRQMCDAHTVNAVASERLEVTNMLVTRQSLGRFTRIRKHPAIPPKRSKSMRARQLELRPSVQPTSTATLADMQQFMRLNGFAILVCKRHVSIQRDLCHLYSMHALNHCRAFLRSERRPSSPRWMRFTRQTCKFSRYIWTDRLASSTLTSAYRNARTPGTEALAWRLHSILLLCTTPSALQATSSATTTWWLENRALFRSCKRKFKPMTTSKRSVLAILGGSNSSAAARTAARLTSY